MAEIVGGFGVPHNPHFPGWVADGAPAAEEIARMYGGVAERLRRVRPDVLLVFTGDHYNIFFEECVPIFSIGVAESADGASDYPELRRRHVPIAADLARHVHVQMVRAGFDVGMSQEFEFDHTVIVPLHFLVPDGSIPVVPVFVNALIPPLPSAARCLALGRAIAAAVRSAPGDARVAAVASGSFSLEIGGPRIVEGMVAGFWALPLVGTADRISQTILDLHAAGIDGLALSWPDFDEGLQQLEDAILPRLVQAGVRRALEPQRQAARMRSA